jgi:hypothetical protein
MGKHSNLVARLDQLEQRLGKITPPDGWVWAPKRINIPGSPSRLELIDPRKRRIHIPGAGEGRLRIFTGDGDGDTQPDTAA